MSDELASRLRNLRNVFADGTIDATVFNAGLAKLRNDYGPAAVDALLRLPLEAETSRVAEVYGNAQIGAITQGSVGRDLRLFTGTTCVN